MATVTLKSSGGLDTRDFARFAKALRKAEPELNRRLRVKLRAAGALVADEAQARAGAVSKKIPPTIKVRTSGLTVSVVAGGNGVPLAGLFELGNKRGGGGGTFRHPVFGRRTTPWVDQPTHPFLKPALEAKEREAQALVIEALDETLNLVAGGGL